MKAPRRRVSPYPRRSKSGGRKEGHNRDKQDQVIQTTNGRFVSCVSLCFPCYAQGAEIHEIFGKGKRFSERAHTSLILGLAYLTLAATPGCADRGDPVFSGTSPVGFTNPVGFANLAVIKDDAATGFSNGGWRYDRYESLEPLDSGARITVADLAGPGLITHIHTTRHRPAEKCARGIVLEIYFDGEERPAVLSPLADFFGDGCNGGSQYFSASLIECAPWSYNCYFPMPFKTGAKVILRNDTNQDTRNYSYVEWCRTGTRGSGTFMRPTGEDLCS